VTYDDLRKSSQIICQVANRYRRGRFASPAPTLGHAIGFSRDREEELPRFTTTAVPHDIHSCRDLGLRLNQENVMIDHVGFSVSDYARAKAFYEKALAPLGYALDGDVGSRGTSRINRASFTKPQAPSAALIGIPPNA
jgi:hypothetical protein